MQPHSTWGCAMSPQVFRPVDARATSLPRIAGAVILTDRYGLDLILDMPNADDARITAAVIANATKRRRPAQ